MTLDKHGKEIIVNCWKCGKSFDIVRAEPCFEHLNGKHQEMLIAKFLGEAKWTTKCSHCGACMCHKFNKMIPIKCELLNKKGIMKVMPSVKKSLNRRSNAS